MAKIVVSGYMVRHPVAGNISTFFQYVLGLHRLGHDVMYLEHKGWPYSCYDPSTGNWEDFPGVGLPLIRGLVTRNCPGVQVVYVDDATGGVDGMSRPELREHLVSCDIFLDVSGMCWLEDRSLAPLRVLVDCDPLFTQVQGFGSKILHDYDVHFSYGVNLGQPGCTVPTAGLQWLPAVPPVVPDLWDAPPPTPDAPLTTVANWAAYGGVTLGDKWYGQKDVEFRRVVDLPSQVPVPVEIALSGANDQVRTELRAAGWRVRDGGDVTGDLPSYAAYIAGSRAEFSVAKHAYVSTNSGWFSERTVCYLASGRPAIVQDTGFSSWLPAGDGVLPFSTPSEAAEAVHLLQRDLPAQSEAARLTARRFFDYRNVLPQLLERALSAAARRAIHR